GLCCFPTILDEERRAEERRRVDAAAEVARGGAAGAAEVIHEVAQRGVAGAAGVDQRAARIEGRDLARDLAQEVYAAAKRMVADDLRDRILNHVVVGDAPLREGGRRADCGRRPSDIHRRTIEENLWQR